MKRYLQPLLDKINSGEIDLLSLLLTTVPSKKAPSSIRPSET